MKKKNGEKFFYENLVSHVVTIIDYKCKNLFCLISRQSPTYLGTVEEHLLLIIF